MNLNQQGKCPWFKNCVGAQCHMAISGDNTGGYNLKELEEGGYVNNLGVACRLAITLDIVCNSGEGINVLVVGLSEEAKKEVKRLVTKKKKK